MFQKATNIIVTLCFYFPQAHSIYFVSKMSAEESLVEKLQKQFRKKLQKLKEEQERLRE
jgi:hypothetical protein